MASTDAKPVPQKNVAYRITFPIFDADGDLVTGATGLDSEVSKDGAAFSDCTNEATEIATSSGIYYLDLTSTEMNADTVAVIIKTSSSGAKTTPIVMYPEEAGDIRVNVTAYGGTAGTFASGRPEVNMTHIAGSAVSTSTAQLGVNVVNFGGSAGTFSAGRPEVNTSHAAGTAWNSGAISANTLASSTINASKIATDAITAAKIADGAIDALTFAAGAIDAAALASDAVAEIADAVWDEDATAHQTQGTFGQAIGDPGADTDTIWALVNTNLNATISSRASQTSVDTIDDFLDTEIAAIITTLGTPAGASISADIAAIEAQTDDIGVAGAGLTAVPWNPAWDAEVQSEVNDGLVAFWTSPATLVDLIWDETLSGHLSAGSTGEALNAAGAGGDPWTTALPGAYSAGQAGYIIGNNINAPLNTIDTVVDAIKAKTDSLTFTVANQLDSNIQYVNDVEVTGNGQSGSEWGP